RPPRGRRPRSGSARRRSAFAADPTHVSPRHPRNREPTSASRRGRRVRPDAGRTPRWGTRPDSRPPEVAMRPTRWHASLRRPLAAIALLALASALVTQSIQLRRALDREAQLRSKLRRLQPGPARSAEVRERPMPKFDSVDRISQTFGPDPAK